MLIWEMVDAWDADWRDLVVRKGGAVVEKETRFMTQGRRNLERLGITPEELTEEDDKLVSGFTA